MKPAPLPWYHHKVLTKSVVRTVGGCFIYRANAIRSG